MNRFLLRSLLGTVALIVSLMGSAAALAAPGDLRPMIRMSNAFVTGHIFVYDLQSVANYQKFAFGVDGNPTVSGYLRTERVPGTAPVFEVQNARTHSTYYTMSTTTVGNLQGRGYTSKVVGYAYATAAPGTVALRGVRRAGRIYDGASKTWLSKTEVMYTVRAAEHDALVNAGWTSLGVVAHVLASNTTPYYEIGNPAGPAGTRAKGIMIVIHGGAWFGDDPSRVIGDRSYAERWNLRGWRTYNIDYRSGGVKSVQDVQWFYDQIAALHGTTLPICAEGQSAGGHLALYLAGTRPKLSCAISNGGPTWLLKSSAWLDDMIRGMWGTDTALLTKYSATTVGPQTRAKVLQVFHESDGIVPVEQLIRYVASNPTSSYMTLRGSTASSAKPFVHGNVTPGCFDAFVQAEWAVAQSVLTGSAMPTSGKCVR